MNIFEEIFKDQAHGYGASEDEILNFITSLKQSLSLQEREEISEFWKKHPEIQCDLNIDTWRFPNQSLSHQFLNFLRWSNSGCCLVNGEREFGFFSTHDTRDMMISYEFPKYLPEALPFALNGGGWFYAFDMRKEPKNGEYPIIFIESGNLSFDDAFYLADSFIDALMDSRNPEHLVHPPVDLPYPTEGSIWLLETPEGGLKTMFLLKKLLTESWGSQEMKNMILSTPVCINLKGNPFKTWSLLKEHKDLISIIGYKNHTEDQIHKFL
ncbi:MAG: hypothetical protein RL095_3932 [Verrucomicrobiota bacterium]|jgi:hypothetical protein